MKFDDINIPDLVKNYDIIILSDYNKGFINNSYPILEKIKINMPTSKYRLKYIIVDPKKDDFSYYAGANIITPNLNELQKATKIKIHDDKSIIKACNYLIEENHFEYIVA